MDGDNESRPVRWVQFTAPVFVRVQDDEDGWDAEISKVIVVVDPDAMNLARDYEGFGVYNERFERVPDRDVLFDGNLRGAVSVAENRQRWPKEQLASLSKEWKAGPYPREDQGEYYLDEDELRDRYPGVVAHPAGIRR
ncbi:hypothetical protein ACIRRA_44760 [Nocardia sp. NPDC101769]|uniref:hypothetical protein n=1 Tax=Nocardia sp. NPDC101769 TaxID=3364333 RepID=UPI00381AED4D